MAKGPSGGARYGQETFGTRDGNATGMPQGKRGGDLMNGMKPSAGGKAPAPPKGTNARYEVGSGMGDD